MTDPIARVAEWMPGSRCAVAFTGDGMSTESGIPDFRSPGGVWDRFDPNEFTISGSAAAVLADVAARVAGRLVTT